MIRRISQAIDQLSALKGKQVYYSVHGDQLQVQCPNPEHVDEHPSCILNLQSGCYYCFGCETKGKVEFKEE